MLCSEAIQGGGHEDLISIRYVVVINVNSQEHTAQVGKSILNVCSMHASKSSLFCHDNFRTPSRFAEHMDQEPYHYAQVVMRHDDVDDGHLKNAILV